jgi:hypothetical protein
VTLEERYSADAPDLGDNDLARRIEITIERVEPGTWDANFLASVLEQNRSRGSLSPRQIEILEKIEGRYSDEAVASRANWAALYGADERRLMRIAAQYYAANPPYYGDLANKVLTDPDFIPTEKQFRSMTNNKYALKIIAETDSDPKYEVGQQIMGRASAGYDFRNKRGFVMQIGNEPVISAARGGKRYLVLPVGSPVPILVEERHIKKAPKAK